MWKGVRCLQRIFVFGPYATSVGPRAASVGQLGRIDPVCFEDDADCEGVDMNMLLNGCW